MTGTSATGGHHYNTRSTNAGPHDSNTANKMDPRVDSDMDNRARHQHMGTTGAPAGLPATSPPSPSKFKAALVLTTLT